MSEDPKHDPSTATELSDAAFAAAVEEGLRDARAGRTSSHEWVVRRLRKRYQTHELKKKR